MKGDMWDRQWQAKPRITVHQLSQHSFRAKVRGYRQWTFAVVTGTTLKQATARARWMRDHGPSEAFQ